MKYKKAFVIYIDSLEILKKLTDEQAGMLFKAIRAYHVARTGDEEARREFAAIMSNVMMELLFTPFEVQFKRDEEKYIEASLRNRINGKKGGRGHKAVNQEGSDKATETEKSESLYSLFDKAKKADKDIDIDKERDKDKDKNIELFDNNSLSSLNVSEEKIDWVGFVSEWNRVMSDHAIPNVRGIDGKRRNAVRARLKSFGLEIVHQVILKAAESRFLNGENNRSWIADIDWIFAPSNFQKILEGKYDNDKNRNYQNENRADGLKQRDEDFRERIRNLISGQDN